MRDSSSAGGGLRILIGAGSGGLRARVARLAGRVSRRRRIVLAIHSFHQSRRRRGKAFAGVEEVGGGGAGPTRSDRSARTARSWPVGRPLGGVKWPVPR